jgi:hypothetical protein
MACTLDHSLGVIQAQMCPDIRVNVVLVQRHWNLKPTLYEKVTSCPSKSENGSGAVLHEKGCWRQSSAI